MACINCECINCVCFRKRDPLSPLYALSKPIDLTPKPEAIKLIPKPKPIDLAAKPPQRQFPRWVPSMKRTWPPC